MEKESTDYYAAFIGSNGRSAFKKPRNLYKYSWDQENRGWDKSGNDYAFLKEGFQENEWGGFVYVSKSQKDVSLVIESSRQVFTGILRSWGVSE